MSDPLISAFTAFFISFTCNTPMVGVCSKPLPSKVEMSILSGKDCVLTPDKQANWGFTHWDDCSDAITSILEIKVDDKVMVSVPSTAIDRKSLAQLWYAVQPQKPSCVDDAVSICISRDEIAKLRAAARLEK